MGMTPNVDREQCSQGLNVQLLLGKARLCLGFSLTLLLVARPEKKVMQKRVTYH